MNQTSDPAEGREVLASFISENSITEVECLVPDLSGIARGKILPADRFLRALDRRGLRLPESIFMQTVTGDEPEGEGLADPAVIDVYMVPDPKTIRLVPWYEEPTAQVICDCTYADGMPVPFSSRQVLRKVVDEYDAAGLRPVVAPELEFFLVKVNPDPDYPLEPPIGRNGRAETARQAYGIDAVNEFDPIFEDVYDYCDAMGIDIDTLSHETGAAQIEINFEHGDPITQADHVLLFKRTVRQAALRHNVYATFMAKPMQWEPGSAMHLHQSVVDRVSGHNLFANTDGSDSQLFHHFIGGLQRYVPRAMALFAPNVNSYRRLRPDSDAPINTHWGVDNRTTSFRVPVSTPDARRVENRVAGADANPYLMTAGSLACGLLGIQKQIEPMAPIEGSAKRLAFNLPRHIYDSLDRLRDCQELRDLLGERFVEVVWHVKQLEFDEYQKVISSWERENLLLNV